MVVGPLIEKINEFLNPFVMIGQSTLVFVKQILLPDSKRVDAFPNGHPAVETAPMSRTNQRQVTVVLLGIVQVVEPLRPEAGHVKIVVIILGHHIPHPADPLGPVGRILWKSLQAAGQGPANVAVNAIDEIIGAGKMSRLWNGVTYVSALQACQRRGSGKTGHFNVTKPMQREAWLPHFFPIAFEDIGIALPREMPRVQITPRIQRTVGMNLRAMLENDFCPARSLHPQPSPTRKILSKVIYKNTRVHLGHRYRLQSLYHLTGRHKL